MFLILIIINTSYAYLKTSLGIKGVVHGEQILENGYFIDKTSSPNLKITDFDNNNWVEDEFYKSQYRFKIKNIGDSILDTFVVVLTFNSIVETIDIWNYTYTIDENKVIITGSGLMINIENEIELNFIVGSYRDDFKLNIVKLDIETNIEEVESENMLIDFQILNNWGSYTLEYNVDLINKTQDNVNAWTIEIPLDQSISFVNGWGGIFTVENNILIIKNVNYNGLIKVNEKITFGLQLQTNDISYKPHFYKVFIR